MSSCDISLLLDDMIESVLAIGQYVQGLTESSFRTNRMAQDAVIRRFEILGEAANQDQRIIASNIQRFPGALWPVCEIGSSTDTFLLISMSSGEPFRLMFQCLKRLCAYYVSANLDTK